MRDVAQYLQDKQESDADLRQEWADLEQLYNKKLWHQLTLKLLEFIKHPSLKQNDQLTQMYENFIADFEMRINPLSLTEIGAIIVDKMSEGNAEDAIAFTSKLEGKVKGYKDAELLCKVLQGRITLLRLNDVPRTKAIVEEAEKLLEDLTGVGPVHSRYYELASELYRTQGKHAEYYRTALRYLGCTDLADIPVEDQRDKAFKLGLAALLGEGVYNFGELLAHPILESLKDTDNKWLVELLFVFNSGDLKRFQSLEEKWATQPDLRSHQLPLRQKISLLCLMEMTFKRPSTGRQLTFTEIAKEADLPEEEVELLVMKSLSLGLLKGSIDQISQKVNFSWVQPRVLDRKQISDMMKRLDLWCKDVQSMEMLLESKASDILTY